MRDSKASGRKRGWSVAQLRRGCGLRKTFDALRALDVRLPRAGELPIYKRLKPRSPRVCLMWARFRSRN